MGLRTWRRLVYQLSESWPMWPWKPDSGLNLSSPHVNIVRYNGTEKFKTIIGSKPQPCDLCKQLLNGYITYEYRNNDKLHEGDLTPLSLQQSNASSHFHLFHAFILYHTAKALCTDSLVIIIIIAVYYPITKNCLTNVRKPLTGEGCGLREYDAPICK